MQQAYPAECFIIFKWIYRLLESKNEAEVKQGLELQFECAPLSKSKSKNEAAYSSVQIANCSSEEIVAINSTESFVKIQRSHQYTSSASDSQCSIVLTAIMQRYLLMVKRAVAESSIQVARLSRWEQQLQILVISL